MSKKNLELYQIALEMLHALEQLKEREERYQQLVETSPDAILTKRESRIVYANTAALNVFHAQNVEDLTDYYPFMLVFSALPIQGNNAGEKRLIWLDDSPVDMLVTRTKFSYQWVMRHITP